MKAQLPVLLLCLSLFLLVHAQNDSNNAAKEWWKHIEFLASDELMGREAGSNYYRKAASYVAGSFKKAGLNPGGTQGYFQTVKFTSRQIIEKQCSLTLLIKGKEFPFVLGDEATFNMGIEHPSQVEAPLVFTGYGLTVPEFNYDDLAGLDLRGKIAVLLSGGPSTIPGTLRAHYQSVRWEAMKRAGAIGVITIQNPIGQDIPWERSKLARFRPSLTLADSSLEENGTQRFAVTINPSYAEKLFTESGHTFNELLKLAEEGRQLPAFALPAILRAKVKYVSRNIESQNVIGILPGTDPNLKNEYLVLSAHLDHIGKGEPINNDPIYNGAMDNASGIATLIETASTVKNQGKRFRRSVIFLAVTAEEAGLRGSKYFAAYPTVNGKAIVADVNVDMFLPLFPLRSLIVQGLEESDLADDLNKVGNELGIKMLSDPEPERRAFVRSDQYSFIKKGIPSISLKVGFVKGSPEHEIVKRWRKERYHAPSDDLNQPVDLQAAADFNRAYLLIVESVANRSERPQWNKDSFFWRFANLEHETR